MKASKKKSRDSESAEKAGQNSGAVAVDGVESPPQSKLGRWRGLGLAVAAGVVGGLAYAPINLRPLIILAPAGLFLAAETAATPRRAFGRTLLGAWVLSLIAISWLMSTYRYNYFAPAGVAFLAFYVALYPAVAAWLTRKFCARAGLVARYGAFAGLWLGGEIFRTLGRLAMPFGQISHAWADWSWAIQWADWFGEAAVTAQIFLGAGAIAIWAGRRMKLEAAPARPWLAPAAFGGALALALVTSAVRERIWARRIEATPDEAKLNVTLIQPHIPQDYKLATNLSPDAAQRRKLREEIMKLHEEMVAAWVKPGTDLVVMPESTFPGLEFNFDQPLQDRVRRMVADKNVGLVFGADRAKYETDALEPDEFNTAWYLPAGADFDRALYQDKMRLVPFGEHLPYFELIPGFNDTFVGIGSFKEGREVHIMEVAGRGGRKVKFGTEICFESTFGAQARKLALAGAEFLAIITNDAWYGESAGAAQHHSLSRLRAVEIRRPIARAANTGISSLIDPAGRLTATAPLGKRGAVVGAIAPRSGRTPYMIWGNLWGAVACVACFGVGAWKSRRTSN